MESSPNSNNITSNQMKSIFYENKAFGQKIFNFFLKNKTHNVSNLQEKENPTISFQDFIYNSTFFKKNLINFISSLVELLIKEPTNTYLDYFKHFDKMELLLMISLEKYEPRRDLLKKIKISYIEALNLAKVLIPKNTKTISFKISKRI